MSIKHRRLKLTEESLSGKRKVTISTTFFNSDTRETLAQLEQVFLCRDYDDWGEMGICMSPGGQVLHQKVTLLGKGFPKLTLPCEGGIALLSRVVSREASLWGKIWNRLLFSEQSRGPERQVR